MMTVKLTPNRMTAEAKKAAPGHSLGIEILLFLIVLLIASVLESIPDVFVTVGTLLASPAFGDMVAAMSEGNVEEFSAILSEALSATPAYQMIVRLFSTFLCIVTVVLYCRLIEKRRLSSLGLCREGAVREYLIGFLIGAAMISASVGINVMTGAVRLTDAPCSIPTWLLFFVGFVIQGMSEELLCCGYLMISVSRKNALWLAVLTNSLLFALLHILNPGVGPLALLNIALFGALKSVYVIRRDSIWGAAALHSVWNFFQGNVFGISVSGTGSGPSPLTATLTDGKTLLNGGRFGIEGGLPVTLVAGITLLLFLFFLPAKQTGADAAVAAEQN